MDVDQQTTSSGNGVAPQQRLMLKFGTRVPALWTAADKFLARAKATQPSTAPAADNIVIEPTPESRFQEVLDHVTPIFLRDEPLSHSFPPCTTGRRERDFRQYAMEQLRSGLSVMATDGPGGPVVGSCLNRPFSKQYLAAACGQQPEAGDLPEDPLVPNVVRLLTTVHRQLDLFSAFGVDEIFELGLASVEPTHVGRGIASRMMRCSLELAAQRGLRAAKGDCTGVASARAAVRAGMSVVFRLPYASYAPAGRVVFHATGEANPELTVVAARLQPAPPHVLPAELPQAPRQ
ncbi:uncharacterized protein LOC126106647 isoform X1 [Schistocerca cancellata]|uniref:uncharacterized protein LOC126106647 isoform X1 n=1 Tax=Schistocerca cancellata TaxID=274614 RepID=UPI0021188742|nr:uncharacterized protein LOC126106647 isoform X1 [Schistocerca cancellata]